MCNFWKLIIFKNFKCMMRILQNSRKITNHFAGVVPIAFTTLYSFVTFNSNSISSSAPTNEDPVDSSFFDLRYTSVLFHFAKKLGQKARNKECLQVLQAQKLRAKTTMIAGSAIMRMLFSNPQPNSSRLSVYA